MPNIKSAKKRVLTTAKRTERNRDRKSALKTDVKKFYTALESGDFTAADEAYKVACGALDSAALHNIVHTNAASRKKARMAIALNKAKAAAAE